MPGRKAPRPGLLISKVFHTPWGSAAVRTRSGYTHSMRPVIWAVAILTVVGCQSSPAPAEKDDPKPAVTLSGPGSKFIEAILREDFTAAFDQVDSQNPDLRNPQALVAAYEAWLARNRRGENPQWRPAHATTDASAGAIPAESVVARLRDRGQMPAAGTPTVYWMKSEGQETTSVAIVILTEGSAPESKVQAAAFVAKGQE